MLNAVMVHEVYKKFENPHAPVWMRNTRRTWQAGGTVDASAESPVVTAVQHVSFTIQPGEIFGVVGPHGAGKSTLIRLIAALLMPDAGQIWIFDQDVVQHPAQARRMINPVSLEASFFKRLSPLENLLYETPGSGRREREARELGRKMLLHLGLDEQEIDLPMEALPRGLQQLVAVARALLARPRLLLLDDPTAGLDEYFKQKVRSAIRELRDQFDATVLLATRDIQEAGWLCDRIAFLAEGKLASMEHSSLGVLQ